MKKKIIIFINLVLILILSSCGLLNTSNSSVSSIKTYVEIYDEYGNRIFVDGKINGYPIILKDGQTGVSVKISEIKSLSLNTQMFNYNYNLEGGKVKINLFKKSNLSKNTVELQKQLDGSIIVYTYKVNKSKLNIWLDNLLEESWAKNTSVKSIISSDENIIASNYLISILKSSPIGTGYFKTGAKGDVRIKSVVLK
ncbi:hypothetical protein HNP65_001302 [Thermosipho japonicus]|uniref:Lipoprotein n=1 Tax=Thermosipho japonicus TaxID=90323 RepID=A0A841GTV1_9BACT|nr:hypothetical protein [Thermosipho japonicus]MBB6062850.1 hypothetical protein [Thermosipho japonicus]